ncbi:hypothetical protein [Paenibacillus taiwanensis]|uniref:hypothetical protein n=1 Tax=Paenibacillus taiwanensis TaxID=401638 RepID=UPI00146B6D58|nr:hypothetical protein [Paenibacillus taiwanensis]
MINRISPYRRDEGCLRGFAYDFPEIGLTLYRSRIITDEDLGADWFKAQSLDDHEYEKKFMYFETVMVCGQNYLNR